MIGRVLGVAGSYNTIWIQPLTNCICYLLSPVPIVSDWLKVDLPPPSQVAPMGPQLSRVTQTFARPLPALSRQMVVLQLPPRVCQYVNINNQPQPQSFSCEPPQFRLQSPGWHLYLLLQPGRCYHSGPVTRVSHVAWRGDTWPREQRPA